MNNNNYLRMKTNWYVITGGPSSEKTTTVNLLRDREYETTIEHARHYLDAELFSFLQIACDQKQQYSIYPMIANIVCYSEK